MNVVVCEGAVVLQLLVGKDEALLTLGKALSIFNPGLQVVNSV